MRLFNNKKLLYLLAFTLILLISIIYAFFQSSQLKNRIEWARENFMEINKLESVVLNISESESMTLGYLLSNDELFLNHYKETLQLVTNDLKSLDSLIEKNKTQLLKYEELKSLIKEKIEIQDKSIELSKSKKMTPLMMVTDFEEGRIILEKLKLLKNDIEVQIRAALRQKQNQSNSSIKKTILGIFLSFIATLIAGVITIIFVLKYIDEENKKKLSLIELNDNKNRLFSIISHDLRAPIKNIVKLTELVHEEVIVEEKNKIIEMIEASIKKVNDLLNDLLKWTSIQMNTISFTPEVIHPYSLVDENFALLSYYALNKKIRLINEINPDITVWGDKEMITTVLRNLISNAIKFTKINGQINVSAHEINGKTEIEVKDNGVGMTSETIDKLLKNDIQRPTSGTSNEVGTGLGLKICKEFLEKNNSKLSITSKLNEGSVFKFDLPSKLL